MATTTVQFDAAYLRTKYEAGLSYDDYLVTNPEKAARWREFEHGVQLTDDQQRLVASFTRTVRVLVLSGIWCGDCVQQCPLLMRFAEANADRVDLRLLERDDHPDLAEVLSINAGQRVPVVIFMAEDFEPVSIIGDRTVSRYRAIAAKKLGPACPLPGAQLPEDEVSATLQDWLDELERVHLLLRLSGRFRKMYGD